MVKMKLDSDGFVYPTEFQFCVEVEKTTTDENGITDTHEDEVTVKVQINDDWTDVSVSIEIDGVGLDEKEKAELCEYVRKEVNEGNVHLPTFIPMSEMDFGDWEGYFHRRLTPEEAAEIAKAEA